MKSIKHVAILGSVAVLVAIAFCYSGIYPVGADVPHSKFTYWILESMRERSVARASKDIKVPPLNDPELLLAGGQDYNEMCASCHLKPGKLESDMSIGLYPSPPNLTHSADRHDHNHGQNDDLEQTARFVGDYRHITDIKESAGVVTLVFIISPARISSRRSGRC